MKIAEAIQEVFLKYENDMIQWRRHFHENPENSGKEVETAAFLRSALEELGMTTKTVSTTGFIATLKGNLPDTGRSIALRADMDALPIEENPNNLLERKCAISKTRRASHMCGHDAHMAMLLAAAHILSDLKNAFGGTVFFCFEEGEEIGSGILGMLDELRTRKPDFVWAIHVYASETSGTISVEAGKRMAGAAGIDITITGRSGHASRPDKAISPIWGGVSVLQSLSQAWNNSIDPGSAMTMAIGEFHSGSAGNIIPDEAHIKGGIRFFNEADGWAALDLIKEVSTHAANAAQCGIRFDRMDHLPVLPIVNSKNLSLFAENSLAEILEQDQIVSFPPWYASESFSLYMKEFPGIFAMLGIKNEEKGTGAEHHNERFDVDEDAMKVGVLSTAKIAIDFLMSDIEA